MRKLLLIVFGLFMCCFASTAGKKTVHITQPDSLRILVGKRNLESLSIAGDLNDNDILFLQQLSRKLKTLDLRRVTFKGGVTINKGMFKGSNLSTVILPEGVVLSDSAFLASPNLANVVFPSHAGALMRDCFSHCPKMESITIHDIDYICYKAFKEIPNLKIITIDGVLGHVDGWFCSSLPSLRKIVFSGYVLTTGGKPMADHCPELSEIVFSGFAMPMGFGSVEKCPKLRQCTVTGIVLGSGNYNFLPWSKDLRNVNTDILEPVVKYLKEKEQLVKRNYWTTKLSDDYYILARAYSLIGTNVKAVQALHKAVKFGFNAVRWMQTDQNLQALHGNSAFENLVDSLRQLYDHAVVLSKAKGYLTGSKKDGPSFTYQSATAPQMKAVRASFGLDALVNSGSEMECLKRLMYWVHNSIRHDGSGGFPKKVAHNSIDLYNACKNGRCTLNCRGLAQVLSELYMAYGWPSRMLTCLPRDYDTDNDCHVIVMVWSHQMKKWIWMDPTFAAFITDNKGQLLGPREVRERMRQQKPWRLNSDANWNNVNKESQYEYADYMAKNLYFLNCTLYNGFESDTPSSQYFTLAPAGEQYRHSSNNVYDDDWFWQPAE